jgi:transcriptional regulator of arginine metabolism
LELVAKQELGTQEALAEALAAEGWAVTQSSVSRDIAALGLIKIDGVYRRSRQVKRPPGDPDQQSIADAVLSIDAAGDALIVLKTSAGEANHVAVRLDRLKWPEIVGTIAGDDTIFVAVRDRSAQARVRLRFKKLQE